MTFGEVVLHYLNTLGVSQSELARRMGTGRRKSEQATARRDDLRFFVVGWTGFEPATP